MSNNFFQELVELQKKSHCVYSNYPVACIVVDLNGRKFYGVNVEISSYGLTICAERNAISSAIVNGSKKIKEIHIICGDHKKTFGSPCGACRQVISDFIVDDGIIVIWNQSGESKEYTIDELLPDRFNKEFFDKE